MSFNIHGKTVRLKLRPNKKSQELVSKYKCVEYYPGYLWYFQKFRIFN